jgi:crotonobetainyl-CoA:carnitine CoA-transferase CaiB-like acyl-CoA transferase
MGASVVKAEPPSGDPLFIGQPDWYHDLHSGIEVITLDLKRSADKTTLEQHLEQCDLLLTSSRRDALARLGLGWPELNARYPRLSQVAITGRPRSKEDPPGHDLSHQAAAGLLSPPEIPKTLIVDLGGALQAVNAALSVLLARERSGEGDAFERYVEVSLTDAAEFFADSLRYGLSRPGGLLGGGLPQYNLYRASDGWVAVAALEPHFWERIQRELKLHDPDKETLDQVFATRAAADWEDWAAERDLPICAVREAPRPIEPGH